MLSVRDGETVLLGQLYERYKDTLFRFFFNLLQNAATSEDLVHNVFIRILKYRSKFRGDGEFKYWLFAIARNVHADYHRKKGIRFTENVEDWQDRIVATDESEERSEQKEQIKRLRYAMRKLEPDKREVLVLSRLHGMKYAEIAELLELTESNVKVRVFRALRKLKMIYEELEKSSL